MLELAVSGQGTDCDRPIGVSSYVAAVGKAVQVDQVLGLGKAEVHRRDQALPAGKELCVISQPLLYRQGLLDALRNVVFEWSRFHLTRPLSGV